MLIQFSTRSFTITLQLKRIIVLMGFHITDMLHHACDHFFHPQQIQYVQNEAHADPGNVDSGGYPETRALLSYRWIPRGTRKQIDFDFATHIALRKTTCNKRCFTILVTRFIVTLWQIGLPQPNASISHFRFAATASLLCHDNDETHRAKKRK